MYRIAQKKSLNPTVTQMDIEAPYVAAKAQAGQFIILRVHKNGERIPDMTGRQAPFGSFFRWWVPQPCC